MKRCRQRRTTTASQPTTTTTTATTATTTTLYSLEVATNNQQPSPVANPLAPLAPLVPSGAIIIIIHAHPLSARLTII
ncbi:hypothetical protein ACLKA7_011274 [Drosophila subpalustris]